MVKGLKVLSVVTAAGLVGLGVMLTESAHAATNGMMIQSCQFGDGDYQAATVSGSNQDGEQTTYSRSVPTGGCFQTGDFWWKGDVTITFQKSASGKLDQERTCTVPEDNGNPNDILFSCNFSF